MKLLMIWRRRRLQRELMRLLSERRREERIHRGNLDDLDLRIQRIERRLGPRQPAWQPGAVTMAVWTSD